MSHHSSNPLDGLQRKYEQLARKYEELVKKYEAVVANRIASSQLAWWALRSGVAGLAMVSKDAIVACNPAWQQLAGRKKGSTTWRPIDPVEGEPAGPRILAEILVEGVRRLEPSKVGAVIRRFQRVGADQVIELRMEPIEGGSDGLVAAMALDISERVRAEREVEQARELLAAQERMRAIGELSSGVAHDLNNTLNAMGLRLGMIANDPVCSRSQGENLAVLARIIQDAAVMVGRVQDFARQRQDRPTGTIDLRAVVIEATDLVKPQLEKLRLAGMRLSIELDVPPLPSVPGLAAELRHVLLNVLLNARDAMPAGGMISIRGWVDDGSVVLTVEDQGTGIPPEDLDRVFNPFFTTKGRRGTGLGLSMAYGVMTRLGGSISAGNRPEGGAVITMRFPRALSREEVQELTQETNRIVPPHHPPTDVLVIDDDRDNLEATRAVIELEGRHADVAESGEEALARIRGGARYDLVLCDVGMPGMSGWQVAQAIRDLAPDTHIYLVTGWAREIAENDPRRRLVAGVLAKPLEVTEIKALLGSGEPVYPA